MHRIFSFWVTLFVFSSAHGAEPENAYDVVGKVLQPLGQVLAQSPKTPDRAVTMSLHLSAGHSSPENEKSIPVQLALEMPDHLRVTAPFQGEEIVVCRRGPQIWAYPGSRLKSLLADPALAGRLPPPNPKFKLAPFSLPVPEKQLAFLPVLFRVQDAGNATVSGEPCRVLDLQLMPELRKSIAAQGDFSARAWIAADYHLRYLRIQSAQGDLRLRFDALQYARDLPASTWQPTDQQSADLFALTPALYDQLLRALFSRP